MPTYTEKSISTGPFEIEPVELGRALSENFSDEIDGDEIVRRCNAWFTSHLGATGVALGAADREIIDLIAGEGWSVAQIVAGWVTRARDHGAT